MEPAVSVVIPHYNDVENLKRCISSILRQHGLVEAIEIIVCDNASSVSLAHIEPLLAGHGRIIRVPEKGAGAARNGGASVAAGQILAFIDSDCTADAHWLSRGCAALAGADIVSGRIDVTVANHLHLTPSEAFELVFAFNNRRYVEEEGFAVTASLIMRKTTFVTVGGFRPLVAEDKEWCLRARQKGFRLSYTDDVAIAHPARRTFPDLMGKWNRLVVQGYHLASETSSGSVVWWLRSLLLPASIIPASVRVFTSPKLQGIKDRIGALSVLIGIRLYRFWVSQRVALRRNGPPQ